METINSSIKSVIKNKRRENCNVIIENMKIIENLIYMIISLYSNIFNFNIL